MSGTDLQALHAAGAEITGHIDAWMKIGHASRFSHFRSDLVREIRQLHHDLRRRVLPSDLPGAKANGRPRNPTPGTL